MHSGSDLSYSQRWARDGLHVVRENLRTRADNFLLVGQLGVFSVHVFPHVLHAFHPAQQSNSEPVSQRVMKIIWRSARKFGGDLTRGAVL